MDRVVRKSPDSRTEKIGRTMRRISTTYENSQGMVFGTAAKLSKGAVVSTRTTPGEYSFGGVTNAQYKPAKFALFAVAPS
jgi:hypothetical protein